MFYKNTIFVDKGNEHQYYDYFYLICLHVLNNQHKKVYTSISLLFSLLIQNFIVLYSGEFHEMCIVLLVPVKSTHRCPI